MFLIYFREDSSTPIMVNKTNGLISLAGTPKGKKYQISVRVSDNGFPVRDSLTFVQIAVKTWNEEIVIFSNASYFVDVEENVNTNTFLVAVKARLKGSNNSVTYSLIDGNLPFTKSSGQFKIDAKTGKIYLIKKLDYELVKKHKLMVRAVTAGGEDGARCFVYVNVVNINDNIPFFESKKYMFNVAENVAIGERLICVSATDSDDIAEKLDFSIVSGNATLFHIDHKTGCITVGALLDHELSPSRELIIQVTDVGGYFDKSSVRINLIDVNDSPAISKTKRYVFKVKEDALIMQKIASVTAEDPDINSRIQYFIKSSTPDNIFAIGMDSGDISLLRQLTFSKYKIEVIIYDGVHVSNTLVIIRSIDVNNHQPVCMNSYYVVKVKENSDLSKSILKIQAKDDDPRDELKYVVQGDGIGKFNVNEKTGIY